MAGRREPDDDGEETQPVAGRAQARGCGAKKAYASPNDVDATAAASAPPRAGPKADAPNKVWAVDFRFEATTDGRPIKTVCIADGHTRECLGGVVEPSVTADALNDELDSLAAVRGYPAVLRRDNAPELACQTMAHWAAECVGPGFIPPGEPWRNGYVDSFTGRFHDECLNINVFWSLAQARAAISDCKEQYNQHRRHSSLGYQAPAVHALA